MHKRHRDNRGTRTQGLTARIDIPQEAKNLIMQLPELIGSDKEHSDFTDLAYLREEYLSKLNAEGLTPASERRANAIQKWLAIETRNAATNRRLRSMDPDYHVLPRVTFHRFLGFAQDFIGKILGPLSDELVLGSFSGGASTSRPRTESLPAHKFVGQADITRSAMPYVDVIHRQAPLLRQLGLFYNLREVEGAKLFTVPKKSDIDRCACKEPEINMFLQKGVGQHIRRRLRKFGINLNDQSINRALARQGSIDGSIATLDLSSASDTITQSCVLALLPYDWYLYLNDIRSPVVDVDGTLVTTEMFSSMGNGFTFELESLLFFALMKATAYFTGSQGIISVYGDDIIVPSGMYDDACWVLGEFGFSPNPDKSFATGSFRESCGGHYHAGEDITPFYLRREPRTLLDLIRVCNQLRRWALADGARQYVHANLFDVWTQLASFVPKDLWGGRDLSVDTQLVSAGPPKNRLVRITGKVKYPEVGAYAAWHNTNWNRSSEPEEIRFAPSQTNQLCRRRRATPGAPVLSEQFIQELLA